VITESLFREKESVPDAPNQSLFVEIEAIPKTKKEDELAELATDLMLKQLFSSSIISTDHRND
jgi:hypothetical protein